VAIFQGGQHTTRGWNTEGFDPSKNVFQCTYYTYAAVLHYRILLRPILSRLKKAIELIIDSSMTEDQWLRVSLSIKDGGLGARHYLRSPFLQKKRLKVRTDDLFTFRSDDVIPGKHNQTAY